MTCPFQRCAGSEVVHCDGACHGLLPDGTPMTEPDDLPELRSDIDQANCFSCQGCSPCTGGPFCVALEQGSIVQLFAHRQLEKKA